MSSYSSAFGRRDDDRRDPPRRDSHSYHSRSSDQERDQDRDRDCSRDRSYRDKARDRARDRERSPTSHTHTGSPRDSIKEPPRPPRGDVAAHRSISSVSSTLNHSSGQSTISADAKSIGQVLRQYGNLITEQASININKEALDKVLHTRRLEYERSMTKHAEFPSMPELQKRYRDKDLGARKALEASSDKNHKEMSDVSEVFAARLLEALPSLKDKSQAQLQLSDMKVKFDEWKTSMDEIQKTRSEKQGVDMTRRISELKSDLAAEIKSELAAQIKSDLVAQIKSELAAQMESELAAQQAKLEKQSKSLADARKSLDAKLQIAKDDAARAKLEALEATKQANKATTQLAVQAREIEELKAKALVPKNPNTAVLNQEITMLKQSDRSLQSNIDQLFNRVDGLTKRLEDSHPGSDTFKTLQTTLAELHKLVKQHDDKLSVIDVNSMDQINEIAIEWNKVRRDLNTLKKDVQNLKSLEQRLDQVQGSLITLPTQTPAAAPSSTLAPNWTAEIDTRFKERLLKFAETFGSLIDGERKSRNEQVELMKAELLALKMRSKSVDAQAAKMTSVTEEHKLKVDKAEQDVVKLNSNILDVSQQLEKMRQDMQTTSVALNEKYDSLVFQVTHLDSRFNNLSTKSLAEQIIGQLEQLYPEGRVMISNIAMLDTVLKDVKKKVAQLEAAQVEFNCQLQISEEYQPAAKKRKLDSSDKHSSSDLRTNGAVLHSGA